MSGSEAKAEVEAAVNAILDCVQTSMSGKPEYAKQMYELILGTLKASNERLWFGTTLRLGQAYLDEKNMGPLEDMILSLKNACKKPDAMSDDLYQVDTYDLSKGNYLLEIFALEIQMCIETKEQRRSKQIFNLSKKFGTVIEDPRV